MCVKDAQLGGVPVQLFRVSFSGELAFEVNIDSNMRCRMWEAFMPLARNSISRRTARRRCTCCAPRKGFVIVGQDTDGSVTPVDLRMNWLLSKDKDYLGRRSLARPDCVRTIANNLSVCCPRTAARCSRKGRSSWTIRRRRCPCRCAVTLRRATAVPASGTR